MQDASASPDSNLDAQPSVLLDFDLELAQAIARLGQRVECHVEHTLLACERFEWMADELRDQIATTPLATLVAVLDDPNARTSAVERALVALAIKASLESGLHLWHWQAPAKPQRLALLHQIVKIEWENRYAQRFGDDAA